LVGLLTCYIVYELTHGRGLNVLIAVAESKTSQMEFLRARNTNEIPGHINPGLLSISLREKQFEWCRYDGKRNEERALDRIISEI